MWGRSNICSPGTYAGRAAFTSGTTPLTATARSSCPMPMIIITSRRLRLRAASEMVVQGSGSSSASPAGLGIDTYAYTESGNGTGYNSWNNKITETLPDGTVQTDYYNAYGEQMRASKDTQDQWLLGTFTEYDSQEARHPDRLRLRPSFFRAWRQSSNTRTSLTTQVPTTRRRATSISRPIPVSSP